MGGVGRGAEQGDTGTQGGGGGSCFTKTVVDTAPETGTSCRLVEGERFVPAV